MTFGSIIRNAMHSLRRNRLQSSLSLLGIVIGVFAVTLIVSMGLGLRAYVVNQIEVFGKNLIAINPSPPGIENRGTLSAGFSSIFQTSLKRSDVDAIRDADLPYITAVSGMKTGQAYAKAGNREFQTIIFAVSSTYPEIDQQALVGSGRFYSEDDERSLRPVVVIGSKAAERLFPNQNPVGQKIKLKDASLTVIGVMKSRGSFAQFDFDTVVFVPLLYAEKFVIGSDFVIEIDIRVSDAKYVDTATYDIARLLRKRHRIDDPAKDDFMITTEQQVKDQVNTVTGAITLLLGFLAAISLLVGGIGIMNIMLVAVVERIHEVGLRKSIGARDADIRAQFLAESVILTSSGGLIGGFLGLLVSVIAVAVARHGGYDVPYLLSLPAFIVAALVSAVVGIVFGLYPARKAASLDPIAALRYE